MRQPGRSLAWVFGAAATCVVAAVFFFGGKRSNVVDQSRNPNALLTSESDLDSLTREVERLPEILAAISDSIARLIDKVSTLPVSKPADGWVSSMFANRRLHPVRGRAAAHRGIDVAAPTGTPIFATGAGKVARVTRAGGYGLLVEVDHGDGLLTRYAHCSRVFVKSGERVDRGARIAAVGNSGLTTGPHLHYEVLHNGQAIDPAVWIGR